MRRLNVMVALMLAATGVFAGAERAAAAVPAGFDDQAIVTGLDYPTKLAIAANGRVFIAERTGRIRTLDTIDDSTPTLVADINLQVYNGGDRGLLGLAVHPNFPASPYVYAAYAYDGEIGGAFPRWGVAGKLWETCPNATTGCMIGGRVSRFTYANGVLGSERVLVEDWCNQFTSHTLGDLAFGADGYLYVTAGDGASYLTSDYGQFANACGDPPLPAGQDLTPPEALGGSLRAQSPRRASNLPISLSGSIVRIDASSGAGAPGNPLAAAADANRKRIVGYGFRNPFRLAIRPGTNDIYIADVGAGEWEEINRLAVPADATADNFGWPCYEGVPRRPSFDNRDLTSCETLYAAGTGAVVNPHFAYNHADPVAANDPCPTGQSAITGLAFYGGTAFPAKYRGGLFAADYARRCIYFLPAGVGGVPNAGAVEVFANDVADPVDLAVTAAGDLLYLDVAGGALHRIRYSGGVNGIPTARFTATPSNGAAPLAVNFDGRTSSDPDGDALTYAWDLDGDGAFDDSTSATPSRTYSTVGSVTVRVQVDDGRGGSDTEQQVITIGNTAPVPSISTPPAGATWAVGDTVSFTGSASDAQDGPVPAARLSWRLAIQHCPDACHEHVVDTFAGVASGSFIAPDHSYPSHLTLTLTATDAGGLSASTTQRLDPRTVTIALASSPTGAQIGLDDSTGTAPRTVTVIARSTHSLGAAATQTIAGTSHNFTAWSDGGARSHTIVAPASGTVTYTATFTPAGGGGACPTGTFRAQYYANTTSTGEPVATRCEDRIAADWGDGAPPGIAVPADGFSVRWTGTFTTAAANYTVTAAAADRLRIKIDENLVLDQWFNREATSFSLNRTLTAGAHQIEVKYAEISGRAVARFQMMKALSSPCSGWTSEFFSGTTLAGLAAVRRCSTSPATSWTGESPTGVGPDDWAGRWTRTETFAGGNYRLTVTCNDGCRLWVDGKVMIDQWADRTAPATFAVTKAISPGTHTVFLEMYDRTGPATIAYTSALV